MIASISLDIANYWTSNDYLTETNERSGTLVAFDWKEDDLLQINTNIDLGNVESYEFKFDTLAEFLKKNDFNFVLGLRNIMYKHNPSNKWTDNLKLSLESNEIDYDEYVVDSWPSPIPSFDIPENVFILRYSYDEYSKIDKMAANQFLFKRFIIKSDWEKYFKNSNSKSTERVIVFCNDIENIILHHGHIRNGE